MEAYHSFLKFTKDNLTASTKSQDCNSDLCVTTWGNGSQPTLIKLNTSTQVIDVCCGGKNY